MTQDRLTGPGTSLGDPARARSGRRHRASSWDRIGGNDNRPHLEDPMLFEYDIQVTIEHGHDNRRSDHYSSTAYWYRTEPHAPFPTLPSAAERMPRDPSRAEE